MKKRIIWLLICLTLFSASALAQQPQSRLNIKLLFPQPSTAPMTAPQPKLVPQEVSGLMLLDISPIPTKVEAERYLVEYFLDEQLIYSTSGVNQQNPLEPSFSYLLDTAQYENGSHKLIVNFWDKSGPSAIGIREIMVNNIPITPNE